MTTTAPRIHNGNIRRSAKGAVHLPYARNPHATTTYSTVPNCQPAAMPADYTITQDSVTCTRCLRIIAADQDAATRHNAALPTPLVPATPAPAADAAADVAPAAAPVSAAPRKGTYRLEFSRLLHDHTGLVLTAQVDHAADVDWADGTRITMSMTDDQQDLARLLGPAIVAHVAPHLPEWAVFPAGHPRAGEHNLVVSWFAPREGSHGFAVLRVGGGEATETDVADRVSGMDVGTLAVYRMHSADMPRCGWCNHPADCHPAPGSRQGNCLDPARPADATNADGSRCTCVGYWPTTHSRDWAGALEHWRTTRDTGRPISHGMARWLAALSRTTPLVDARAQGTRPLDTLAVFRFVNHGTIPADPTSLAEALNPHTADVLAPGDPVMASNLTTALEQYLEHHGPREGVPSWHDAWL